MTAFRRAEGADYLGARRRRRLEMPAGRRLPTAAFIRAAEALIGAFAGPRDGG
ncbi:hypothetical protein [Falsiroseomonas sp.]|uniref:hypothetical protein n=1 Tax=Falsiroseomonas sp. TaxID=2870721 RepID=UPI00356738F1